MAVDTRPTTLTAEHLYNLRNQGWPTLYGCSPTSDGNGTVVETDPVDYTFAKIGKYPSNADIIWQSKLSAADDVGPIGSYSPWALKRYSFGNTPAAKGHFILEAFDRNRQDVSGIDETYDPDRDKTDERPISVAFYTGRVWYLMPNGTLYFSQVLTEIENAEKCYQEADPTTEDINELVATDGGEIDISGIAAALKLIPIRAELAVLADNGIWTVSGTADEAFSATSQELRKITSVGAISADSVVEAEGTIFYWAEGGIYVLTQNEVTAFLEAQNITDQTIQTFYNNIGVAAKKNSRGFYDKAGKKIYWLYNDTDDYDGESFRYRYNKVLIFDIVLNAFYTYTMDSSGDYPFVAGMIKKAPGSFSFTTQDVTDDGNTVTDGGEDVTVEIKLTSTSDVKLKLLTFAIPAGSSYRVTFSEFRADDMLDWEAFDDTGIDFTSYIETGYDIAEDLISEKEANTVYCFFKRTEQNIIQNSSGGLAYDYPSGCQMRAKWQWSDSETSGRWSDQQQVYRLQRHHIPAGTGTFDYGFDVIQTINQVRGKGRALQLRFDSETGKDFYLLGWAIPYTMITGA